MSLSRAAKKFRNQTPENKSESPRPPAPVKKKAEPPPAPAATPAPAAVKPVEAVEAVEPTPQPEPAPVEVAEAVQAAPPKKVWPAKATRPRFVRQQAQKRERPASPALPPRSTKFTARLLTKNLALPPAGEEPKASR